MILQREQEVENILRYVEEARQELNEAKRLLGIRRRNYNMNTRDDLQL
jgi:hypothetical protein